MGNEMSLTLTAAQPGLQVPDPAIGRCAAHAKCVCVRRCSSNKMLRGCSMIRNRFLPLTVVLISSFFPILL